MLSFMKIDNTKHNINRLNVSLTLWQQSFCQSSYIHQEKVLNDQAASD
jgi:hypothetical protein